MRETCRNTGTLSSSQLASRCTQYLSMQDIIKCFGWEMDCGNAFLSLFHRDGNIRVPWEAELVKSHGELRTEAREETVGVESCIFLSVQLGGWRDPFNKGSLGIRLGSLRGRAFWSVFQRKQGRVFKERGRKQVSRVHAPHPHPQGYSVWKLPTSQNDWHAADARGRS